MRHELIHLKDLYPLEHDPILEVFVPTLMDAKPEQPRRAMLVLPGGGYYFCSEREKDPICLRFNLLDYVTFSLKYSTSDVYGSNLYPHPYLEVMAAVDYIKKHAEEYFINKDKITIIGFSAGGHLAASYGYMYKDETLLPLLNLSKQDTSIESLILSYPVISLLDFTHLYSSKNLAEMSHELKEKLSAQKHVTKDYPRTYIWTTKNDTCVPYENSLMMVEALKENNVEHEFKLFEEGPHGLSLATYDLNPWLNHKYEEEISVWPILADKFIKKI